MSGLFSCHDQKASFQLEVNHFAAMIMVATSMPKEIINDNTLNVLILITANPRVDQQRLDPFRGLKFNIVLSIIKVNRLEVPNSHLGDQQEPLSICNYMPHIIICDSMVAIPHQCTIRYYLCSNKTIISLYAYKQIASLAVSTFKSFRFT